MILNFVDPLERGTIREEGEGIVDKVELKGLDSPFYHQGFTLDHGVLPLGRMYLMTDESDGAFFTSDSLEEDGS